MNCNPFLSFPFLSIATATLEVGTVVANSL